MSYPARAEGLGKYDLCAALISPGSMRCWKKCHKSEVGWEKEERTLPFTWNLGPRKQVTKFLGILGKNLHALFLFHHFTYLIFQKFVLFFKNFFSCFISFFSKSPRSLILEGSPKSDEGLNFSCILPLANDVIKKMSSNKIVRECCQKKKEQEKRIFCKMCSM